MYAPAMMYMTVYAIMNKYCSENHEKNYAKDNKATLKNQTDLNQNKTRRYRLHRKENKLEMCRTFDQTTGWRQGFCMEDQETLRDHDGLLQAGRMT